MFASAKLLTIALVLVSLGSAYFTASELFRLSASRASFDRPLSAEQPAPPAVRENPAFPNRKNVDSSTSLTSGWKIYRNEKYGFEVKYPDAFPLREAQKSYPPSVFTLLSSKDNVNISGFLQVVPQDGITIFPFSAKFDSPPKNLAALADAFRAKDKTVMKSVGLSIAVAVSDIKGSGGLKGIKSYVKSAPRADGTKIIGIGYYFYRSPYFYRLVTIVPGADPQLSSVASTFKFIP